MHVRWRGYARGVLPYACYLRVYEPLAALAEVAESWVAQARRQAERAALLAREQHLTLTRVLGAVGPRIDRDEKPAAYVLRRAGATYACPVDLPLRSWLSLSSLVDSIGDTAATAIFPPQALATAGEDFLRWRRDHPGAVPHIRQNTWGVPRTWFVLVVEEERESYTGEDVVSVRYRTRMADARRRLAAASRLLDDLIDDTELVDELASLTRWLESFDDASWVELDYAGVARLLGDALRHDQSARDVHRAIDALRREDFAVAAAHYRAFEERWRAVSAYERAN